MAGPEPLPFQQIDGVGQDRLRRPGQVQDDRQPDDRLTRGEGDDEEGEGLGVDMRKESTEEDEVERGGVEDQLNRQQQPDGVSAGEDPIDKGPYDLILLSGAVAEIPSDITEQLDDGGRLVAVVDEACTGLGRAVLVTRFGEAISERPVYDASTPILPGFGHRQEFVF